MTLFLSISYEFVYRTTKHGLHSGVLNLDHEDNSSFFKSNITLVDNCK